MSMSTARTVLRVFGVFYVLIGVLGFIPGITVMTSTAAGGSSGMPGEGLLLGIFAVNVIHNIAHIVLGLLALWGGRSDENVRSMATVLAVLFAVLFIGGFFAPIVEAVALNVPDMVLHIVSAAIMAWVAWGVHAEVTGAHPA